MFRVELGNCGKAALFSQKIHFLQLSAKTSKDFALGFNNGCHYLTTSDPYFFKKAKYS